MAGGFTTYNKVRPGAYIVFEAARQAASDTGYRGIATVPMALNWGADGLTMVTAEDLRTNHVLNLLGYASNADELQVVREILKGTPKVLVGRLTTDGAVAASGELITGVTATALQVGALGNTIRVVYTPADAVRSTGTLSTFVDGLEVDRQFINQSGDYIANSWFTLSGANTPFAVFDVTLENGDNGTLAATAFTDYLDLCSEERWNVMAWPFSLSASEYNTHLDLLTNYVRAEREDLGHLCQVVVCNAQTPSNYEGIISVSQGYKTDSEEVPPTSFAGYVAGVTAGALLSVSNTYRVIENATDIINPMKSTEIENALLTGQLVLSRRQDRAVVIEKDINTLHQFTETRTETFSKNRVIRILDDIANNARSIFERSYIGKVENTESGRTLFKGDLVGYLNGLQTDGVVMNFDAASDLEVLAGNTTDSVIVNLAVQPVDAIEKLYMTVTVS